MFVQAPTVKGLPVEMNKFLISNDWWWEKHSSTLRHVESQQEIINIVITFDACEFDYRNSVALLLYFVSPRGAILCVFTVFIFPSESAP